jgi:hypothetical protein
MRRITALAASVAFILCLGSGGIAAAAVVVPAGGGGAATPTIVASFSAPQALIGDIVTISVTIKNPNSGAGYTSVGVPIYVSTVLVAHAPQAACGTGTVTIAGNEALLANGTIAASTGCTFSFKAKAIVPGLLQVISSPVTSSMGASVGHIDMSMPVVSAPSISASYSPASIIAGGTSSLVFSLSNPSGNTVAVTNAGLLATLPSGLSVKSGSSSAGACGGTVKRTAPTGVRVSGVKIPIGGNCKIIVAVSATSAGTYTTKGTVHMDYGSGGGSATAALKATAAALAATPTPTDSPQAPASVLPTPSPSADATQSAVASQSPSPSPSSGQPVAPASTGGDSGSLALVGVGVAIGLLLALVAGAGAWLVMRRKRPTAPAG